MTDKIDKIIDLIDVPNVDDKPEESINMMKALNLLVEVRGELEQRSGAGQIETLVNCPKPFTAEFLNYLLVNALRNLNEAQRHNLAISLAVRDSLL